jgi:type IV pilus assembly protein PilB
MEPGETSRFKRWVDLGLPFREGPGCIHCVDVGYRGRTAVHELLAVGLEIRSLISSGASDSALAAAATEEYIPMWHDGLTKVEQGMTTLRELTRVVQPDTTDVSRHRSVRVAP